MLRGIYASATGMIAQTKQIDVIGNNISNTDTPGFKKDELSTISFKSQLLYNLQTGGQVGSAVSGVMPDRVSTDIGEGPVQQTDLDTDLAILSGGFFAVQGANGVEYTRNGNFTVDAQGYLALPAGQRLLGSNGAIRVGTDHFTVSSDGTVTQNGTALGRILLYASAGAQGTVKQADGLFSLTGAAAVQGVIRQGYLEGSNVDMINEMTKLMASSRAYQSCQQAFKVSDQSEQLTVEQVGSLK